MFQVRARCDLTRKQVYRMQRQFTICLRRLYATKTTGNDKVMIDSLCQSLEQDLIQNEFLIKTLEISDFELRFCKPVCTG